MDTETLDVVIIGAGISGICAAYNLQRELPGKSYAILERRASLGGTWDLFRYPGVRSDSDMYTLGFPFRPWSGAEPIADGHAILQYIRDTAAEFGIDRHVRCNTEVASASWDSGEAMWTLELRDTQSGDLRRVRCRFVLACAGYYAYDRGYTPELPGLADFAGKLVHPQHWDEDYDYAGKRVIVVGSGATAVTLVPALARQAEHVVMLQRSPTYVVSAPRLDRVASVLEARLPDELAYAAVRWKNIAISTGLYWFCRRFPARARALITAGVREQLGEGFDVDTHFNPDYDPWDQRLCLSPGGDLFEAIREGRASVVTDHIERITAEGIELRSGETVEADVIVTATGLRLQFLGGVELEVDGHRVAPAELTTYKGMMFADVPNLIMFLGYTNASWTLKANLTAEYACRVLRHMDERDHATCCPRLRLDAGQTFERVPVLDFKAGYVQRALHRFPRQGTVAPWRLYQNFFLDSVAARLQAIDDGTLEFSSPARARPRTHESRRGTLRDLGRRLWAAAG